MLVVYVGIGYKKHRMDGGKPSVERGGEGGVLVRIPSDEDKYNTN